MKTKYIAITITILMLATSTYGAFVHAKPNNKSPKPGDPGFTGPHFNLNIHGIPDNLDKFKNDSIGSGRHSIFVPLDTTETITGHFNITLAVASDPDQNWTVLDCDGTVDGTVSIILPRYVWVNVSTNGGWEWIQKQVDYYNVYVVGLGKPTEHKIVVEPQAYFDNVTNKVYYQWDSFDVPGHGKGKGGGGQPKWQNVTNWFFATTTLWNGTDFIDYVDTWVFDIPLDEYWWKVTNEGIKLMKVRFYPVFKGNGK
jgi:hypothetical protein